MYSQKTFLFATVFLSLLTISSVVNAGIVLTINDLDASTQPLELKVGEPIIIGLSGEAELKQKKYDLLITATGGTLQESTAITSKESTPSESVQITTDYNTPQKLGA